MNSLRRFDDKTADIRKKIMNDYTNLYTVKSGAMYRDGIEFYRSVNGVWLTKAVPVEYLERVE